MTDPSTSRGRVPPTGQGDRLRLQAGVCASCRAPIYVDVSDPDHAGGWSLRRQQQAAIQDHLASHPAAVLARWRERARQAPPPRACYTLDEALGSAAVYGLWLEARRHAASPPIGA